MRRLPIVSLVSPVVREMVLIAVTVLLIRGEIVAAAPGENLFLRVRRCFLFGCETKRIYVSRDRTGSIALALS